MAGPFRFNEEPVKSPLDRTLSPFSAGQPVSYKTNLNRAKTRKWVEAKKNAYDGDDWGDYDEYDEYGVDTPPQQPEPSAAQPSRSFTDPYRQAPLPKPRKNSFDAGEEHRAFSASIPTPHTHAPSQQHTQPPPIQTQFPPAPSTTSPNSQFPPRKSSIGQHDFSPVATSPRARTGSSDKPLPFIRPADIYKRVEEERVRERASLDSSRPSLDSLSHDGPTSPVADKKLPQQQPLDTVAERKSEYLPDVDVTKQQEKKELPQIEGLAALDSDFWSSSPDVQPSVVSPSQDQGLRAVVDKAFTRTDDQNSVPPTPVSKDAGSDMSRSNTGSTSGISPIMSRVPSSATSALKNRNLGDGTTPVIAEEPGEAGSPVSRPTSMHIAQAAPQALHSPPPSHSRNLSSSSLPRSGLATPTRGESPARSPVIASHSKLPEPEAAQIAADSPDSPEGMDGGLSGPSSAYATRESDIAAAMLNSPKSAAPELSAASKQSQDAFLDSHHAQSSISDALPRERSESPSKGRVQALAGKFGDVSHSRRGSTQSNVSRNSVQSWERSHDNSRAASPTKGPSKPSSPTKEFRPKLPGQWESYATMAVTPSDQGQNDRELGQNMAASSLADADLTPTTPSRPVDEINSSERFDPISALKEAGAAMGESLRESVGFGHSHYSEKKQDPDDFKRSLDGEEYMPRPLQLDRTVSALSSTPPTPPQKNTPILEYPPSEDEDTAPPLSRPQRPLMVPQMSTDIMAGDQESDRLRKEIVASLSPARTPAVLATEPHNMSLRPGSQDGDRTSSILNDYYGEYGPESPPLPHDVDRDIGENAPSPTQPLTPQKPVVLNRFSWEEKGGLFLTPDKQAQDAVPEPTKGGDKISSPASEHVKTEQYPGGHPDAYFGPEHTFTVTKPDPLTDADLATQPTTPPVEPAMGLSSPTREQTRSPGLHIVNSSLDPEAVDLPPRWSAEHSPHSNATQEKSGEPEQPVERISSNPAVSASIGVPEPHNVTNTDTSLPEPSPVHETDKQLPTADISQPSTSDKPLGAREIATISSASERIATYNKTRDHWATTDHGLGAWLASAHEANPSLATQSYPQPRPQSGAPRHKHTGSLAMLGKFTGSMTNQDAQSPSHANPPTTASASESGPGGFLSRTASHSIQTKQMQAKGKDLLHTAGVLSGKGMTSAKGLFAKGKSRFNRDKDSIPTPDGYEEPNRRPTALITRASTDTSLIQVEKKRRRFSSPFRRSRSRPASAALPSTVSFTSESSGPASSDLPKAFGDRPHSYHAPGDWIHPAYRTLPEQDPLGVLPSPSKSSDQDTFIPPVPPIPEALTDEARGRKTRRITSHAMLQSIIRHATPPAKTSRSAGASPLIGALGEGKTMQGVHPATRINTRGSLDTTNNDESYSSWSRANRHSTPVARGLWLGAVSPVPAKQTLAGEANADRERVSEDSEASMLQRMGHRAPLQYEHQPWPVESSEDEKRTPWLPQRASIESKTPLSQEAADVSPLLAPTKAPMDDISDNEERKHEENGLRQKWETELVGAGDVSDEEDGAPGQLKQELGQHKTGMIGECDVSPTVSMRMRPANDGHEQCPGRVDDALQAADISAVSTPSEPGNTGLTPATQEEILAEQNRPTLERFYTAVPDNSSNGGVQAEAQQDGNAQRPGIERFETAQETAHGPMAVDVTDVQEAVGETLPDSHVAHPHPHPHPQAHERGDDSMLQVQVQVQVQKREGDGALTPMQAERAGSRPASTRRVSATPYQVVHAVEEYAASTSSLASWDQDSFIADSHSEISKPDINDDSDLITPKAPVPSVAVAQPEQHTDQAGRSNTTSHMDSNEYFPGHAPPEPGHQAHQQTLMPEPSSPERSKSLLSVISSMVSDSAPISPASSNAGRSTPSTIHRMQRDYSTSMRNQLAPAQILEEPTEAKDDHTPRSENEDFDLYADHNGVVKDVRDESGYPLRVASTPTPEEQPQRKFQASPVSVPADAEDDAAARRFSFERPMSFISGPTDEDGRPQDQINQQARAGGMAASRKPKPYQRRSPPKRGAPGGANPSVPPAQDMHWPPGESVLPSQPVSDSQPSTFMDASSGDLDQRIYSNTSPPMQPASSVPSQPSPLTPDERSLANSMQTSWTDEDYRRKPTSRDVASQQQTPMPDTDPRATGPPQGPPLGPPLGPPHTAPPPGFRNDFEYQQYLMKMQTNQTPPQGSGGHVYGSQTQLPIPPAQKPQEKQSSKPKLSNLLRGFGGKTSPNAHQTFNMPNAMLNPNPDMIDASERSSFQSGTSNASYDPATSRPGETQSQLAPPNRPTNTGAEMQHGYHPVDPRQQQTPANPGQAHSNTSQPPHSPSYLDPTTYLNEVTSTRPPEMGKKKRFSAFTGLFGRGPAAGDGMSKIKLSREEKKAQKAQRHSAMANMQPQQAQQWPPVQQQPLLSPQFDMRGNPGLGPPQSAPGMHPMDPRFVAPQVPQGMSLAAQDPRPLQALPQQHKQQPPQLQPQPSSVLQQRLPGIPAEQGSAYLNTRQLAQAHQAQKTTVQGPRPVYEDLDQPARPSVPTEQPPQLRQADHGPPATGYYNPDKIQPAPEPGAYKASHLELQRQQQQRQQQLAQSPGAYTSTQADIQARQQAEQQRQLASAAEGAYNASRAGRDELLQQQLHQRQLSGDQPAYAASQAEQLRLQRLQHEQMQQRMQPQPQHQSDQQRIVDREQNAAIMRAERQLAHQQWLEQQRLLQQSQFQQQALAAETPPTHRAVSGSIPGRGPLMAPPVSQRHVSSPMHEPQYETPEIPAAYNHVSGAFISPRDEPPRQPLYAPPSQFSRQHSDPQMQPVSPQISGQSQMPPNNRTHSDASTVSVVSPISASQSPNPLPASLPNQRVQKPRMSSISEVHQEKPWHMNFPDGATEQEIVGARQRQYVEQQFAAQQQLHAERIASSPSPRKSPSMPHIAPDNHPQQNGGFREVLPRNSPQPYPVQQEHMRRLSPSPQPRHEEGAYPPGWPLASSPDPRGIRSPANPLAETIPPPPLPHQHSPSRPSFQEHQVDHPYEQQPPYDLTDPDEAPPSYDGPGIPNNGMDKPHNDHPGIPNNGMDKARADRPRPPNILTDTRQHSPRPRQASIGILQHPQPASMAASPQRSAVDMGAESLRRQLLQQEETAHLERLQRTQMQIAEAQRERAEREAARARARELERSVSGGGRVGSLRSVTGSTNGGTPGWERPHERGARPVFELPAVTDDEPVMHATSFPGQEWVPPMWMDE